MNDKHTIEDTLLHPDVVCGRVEGYHEGYDGCPRCGCKADKMRHMVLTVLPPIYVVECPNCGWDSYRSKMEETRERD